MPLALHFYYTSIILILLSGSDIYDFLKARLALLLIVPFELLASLFYSLFRLFQPPLSVLHTNLSLFW